MLPIKIKMEKENKSEEIVPEAAMELQDRPRIAPVGHGKEIKQAFVADKKPEEELKPAEPEMPKKVTEGEALDLTKAEQVVLLEKLGAENIPRYEKDRVALILKLQ